ncbi:MAG: polysaccharide biosynthesis C-terminal domain-containing protein [Halobacteriovoraceae bacterium]|nr:polysaccharide biosynthesis C-terminal domain-containing protein [Halobacteriovoraceae bacterium]
MEIVLKLLNYIFFIGLTKSFSFFFNLYIYSQLDTQDYGSFQYYFSLVSMIFIPFVDSLLDLKLVNNENGVNKILKIKCSFFLTFMTFLLIYSFYFKLNLLIVILFSAHYFFLSLRSHNVTLLRRSLLYKYEQIIMFIEKFLPILILFIFYLLNLTLDLKVIMIILLSSSILSFITSTIFRQTQLKKEIAIAQKFSGKQTIKHTFFAILASYFMAIYFKVDQIMIGNLIGIKYVANYALSVKFLEVFFLIPGLCMSYFFPRFSEQIKTKTLNAKYHLGLFFALGLALSCLFSLLNLIKHQYIINIRPFFTPWVMTLTIVTLGHYLTQILVALKREKVLLYITLIAVIINAVLNYLTIPKAGPVAAAYSTFITETLVVIFCLIAALKSRFRIEQ